MSIDRGAPAAEPALVVTWITLLPVLSVVQPPETLPFGRIATHAAGFLALLFALSRPGVRASAPPRWVLVMIPFAAAAVLLAPCRSRAVDELFDASALLVAGWLGRELASRNGGAKAMALVMTALGVAVALDAVVQHHWIYPESAVALDAVPGDGSPAVVGILKAGRPSGPFILPATLGGFLALSISMTLGIRRIGTGRIARGAILLALALQGYALALTRSIGAVLALAASLTVMVLIGRPRRRVAIGISILVLATLGTGYFLVARGLEAEAASGNDPLSLRLGNWRAAGMMILEHPFFGVGPGSFATAYPRFMRAGMNETRYAHNSYLQALATWGLWTGWLMAVLWAAIVRRARAVGSEDLLATGALAAGVSFLVHNMGDFTAWLPGVAIPAAILLGLALGAPPAASEPSTPGRRACLLVPLVLVAAIDLTLGLRRGLMERSLAAVSDEAERGDADRALSLARRAVSFRPEDPRGHAFLAEMILEAPSRPAALAREGELAADRALVLDPNSAVLHYTRALYYQAAGETAAAFRERYAAHRLYPRKALYHDPPAAPRTP